MRTEGNYESHVNNTSLSELLATVLGNAEIYSFLYYPVEKKIVYPKETCRAYGCKRVYHHMPDAFLTDFIDAGYDETYRDLFQKIEDGAPCAQGVVKFGQTDRYCRITMSTIKWDENHKPVLVAGLMENSTEEKNREKMMHKVLMRASDSLISTLTSERENRDIIQSLSSMFISMVYINLAEGEGHFLSKANDFFQGVGGIIESKRLVQEYCEVYVEESFRAQVRAFLDTDTIADRIGRRDAISCEYRRNNLGWCRGNLLPVRRNEDGEVESVVFAVQIIDEEKALELENRKREMEKIQQQEQTKQALQVAFEAANRANQAKSDFLSRMSHDIRTPMNAIMGMTAIAETHLDDKARVADCLQKISESGNHLLTLINEVLDMSKIESGNVLINEREFNLADLVGNILTMTKVETARKKQQLTVQLKQLEHERVFGDSPKLQQVFMNIVGNAIKYTPDGGRIALTIEEKESHIPGIGRYEFVFQDNGIGMSEEFVKRIYEPFSRADEAVEMQIQGTGLGMVIAKGIVQMMDGDIQVESEPGKGSVFTVNVALKYQEEKTDYGDEFEKISLLLVDNNEDICKNAAETLQGIGVACDYVTSGSEAVETVKKAHERGKDYYVVLIDRKMPGMNGIATAREITRCMGENRPILVLATYDWSEIEVEARQAGIDEFVSRPYFKSRLVRLLHKLVNGEKQAEQESPLKRMEEVDYSGKKALLVEDHPLNAEIAAEFLRRTGLDVEHAANGKEAVDRVIGSKEGYYDIIFMDIQMPIMNGYEASRAIRALDRKDARTMPIIAMTANAFMEDVKRAKESGMNEHMAKPINIGRLLEVLEKWIR